MSNLSDLCLTLVPLRTVLAGETMGGKRTHRFRMVYARAKFSKIWVQHPICSPLKSCECGRANIAPMTNLSDVCLTLVPYRTVLAGETMGGKRTHRFRTVYARAKISKSWLCNTLGLPLQGDGHRQLDIAPMTKPSMGRSDLPLLMMPPEGKVTVLCRRYLPMNSFM